MAMGFSAELKDAEIQSFFKKLNANLGRLKKGQLRPAVDKFGIVIFADIEKHFIDALGPTGPWDTWSTAYAKHQAERGRAWPNNALRDSGFLRQSFKPTNYTVESKGVVWYNNAKTKSGFAYAYHHDEGAAKTRPFMWLSRDALELISKTALDTTVEE